MSEETSHKASEEVSECTSGLKSGLPWHGILPEMTSKQKSAGFSFGGSSKPRLLK